MHNYVLVYKSYLLGTMYIFGQGELITRWEFTKLSDTCLVVTNFYLLKLISKLQNGLDWNKSQKTLTTLSWLWEKDSTTLHHKLCLDKST